MNKPHLLKHNGIWLIKQEVDPEDESRETCCEGCIGQSDEIKCLYLPDCSKHADNSYGFVNYIFKEFQNNYKDLE